MVARALLVVLALILVGIGGALALVHTDWGRDRLRTQVEAVLATHVNGTVKIGKIEGSVLGELVVRDITLREAGGASMVTLDVLRTNLGVTELLSRKIRIEHLDLEGLHVTAVSPTTAGSSVSSAKALFTLADLIIIDEEPLSWDVVIDRLAVDGDVHWTTADQQGHLDALRIRGSVSVLAGQAFEVGSEVDVTARWRELGADVLLRGQLQLTSAGVVIPTAELGLGEARVQITEAAVRGDGITGAISMTVPPAWWPSVLTGTPIVADTALVFRAAAGPGQGLIQTTIDGTLAGSVVAGVLVLDPGRQRLSGHLETTGLSPSQVVIGGPVDVVSGRVDLDVTIDPERPTLGVDSIRASVALRGQVGTETRQVALVVFAGLSARQLWVAAGATGPGGARAGATVQAKLGWTGLEVHAARLVGSAPQLALVVPAQLRGPLTRGGGTVDLTVAGKVDEAPEVTVRGTVTGRGLHLATSTPVDVGAVHVTIDAAGVPAHPTGHVHVVARDVDAAGEHLGRLDLDARTRRDGRIAVRVSSTNTRMPVAIDALVDRRPDAVAIALGTAHVKVRDVDLRAQGGLVTIRPHQIDARDVRVVVDGGTATVAGSYHRGGGRRRAGDVDVRAQLKGFELGSLDRLLDLGGARGRVDVSVDGAMRAGRVTGEVGVAMHQVRPRPGAPAIDLSASAVLSPTRITIDGTARGPEVGGGVFALDVVPPRDVTDLVSWRGLDARAVRADLRVGSAVAATDPPVDLAALSRLAGIQLGLDGKVEGELHATATGVTGRIIVRDLTSPRVAERVDATLTLDGKVGAPMAVTAVIDVEGIGALTADATIATPARPLDLAAWARLDQRAVASATVRAEGLPVGPIAARLGLPDRWLGRLSLKLDVEPGLTGAAVRVGVVGLRGGPLRSRLDAEVTATVGVRGLDGTLVASLGGLRVVRGSGHVEVPIDALARRGLAALWPAPVTATLTADEVALAPLARAVGRYRGLVGTVDLAAKVAGTVGAPTGELTLEIRDLRGALTGLGQLSANARWDGKALTGEVVGAQPSGGRLALRGTVAPGQLAAARTNFTATGYQLAGLAPLLPGPGEDLRGLLDADVQIRGVDPATAVASGLIQLTEARLPVAPAIGTLSGASVKLTLRDRQATLALEGRIGAGVVELDGSATLAGLIPERAVIDVRATKIQLVNALQPILSGKVHVDVVREGDHWRATASVRKGRVVVPEKSGADLHATAMPDDLVIDARTGGRARARGRNRAPSRTGARARLGANLRPQNPFLIASIDIEPVDFQLPDLRGEAVGALTASVGIDVIAVDGTIEAPRGELTLLDRRYRIEQAKVIFDGGIDPQLDVLLSRSFPELTLFIAAGGRASRPVITFRSDPSTYSQGELLSFVLGGSPGVSPGGELEGAALGVATSTASSALTGVFIHRLPFRVDTLAVEAPTARSSTAFKAGRWLSRNLYVAYRRRVEARADQNTNEAELEYWLARRLVIEAVTGDGVHGLDLLWSRRW